MTLREMRVLVLPMMMMAAAATLADAAEATAAGAQAKKGIVTRSINVPLTLVYFGGHFLRVDPDGTRDTDEFVVPAGQTAVITDVNWSAFNMNTPSGASDNFMLSNEGSPSSPVVFTTIARAGSDGMAFATHTLTSGIAFGAGRRIQADVSSSFVSAQPGLITASLHGYLMPE
jgi:hypothetical protein